MICGTHLQQHLVEGEQGFFVLCSTKETKPHYYYTQRGHMKQQVFDNDNTLQEALRIACDGDSTVEQ